MKGIIIYKSRYGAAGQYAQWLAGATGAQAVSSTEVKTADIAACDYVVVGSSIYMGKILLKDWLAAHEAALKGKEVFIFIVGAAPPHESEKVKQYFADNLSPALLAQSRCFYLQGKSVFKQLHWYDKFFLKMGAMLTKDPKAKAAMLTDFDAVKKENLRELQEAVQAFAAR